MVSRLLIIGGSIFALMGGAHAILSVVDVFWPTQFTPMDDSVRQAMQSTGMRFAGGRVNMWGAWMGFNISHGLGAFLFGAAIVFLGMNWKSLDVKRSAILLPILVGLIYFVLSIQFWFYGPAIGSGVATVYFVASWLSY